MGFYLMWGIYWHKWKTLAPQKGPPSQDLLEKWAKSRPRLDKGDRPHILTVLLKLTRVKEENTPKRR